MLENILYYIFSAAYLWLSTLFLPTSVIGVIVGFIAIQQYILAKSKFEFDRYEKRYQLYEVTRDYLDLLCNILGFREFDHEECDKAHKRLKSRMDDALFILNLEVYDYLCKVSSMGSFYLSEEKNIQKFLNRNKGISVNTPQFIMRLRNHHSTRTFIVGARQDLPKVFAKSLTVDDTGPILKFYASFSTKILLRKHMLRTWINKKSDILLNISLFPISLENKIIFTLIIFTLFISLWIVVG